MVLVRTGPSANWNLVRTGTSVALFLVRHYDYDANSMGETSKFQVCFDLHYQLNQLIFSDFMNEAVVYIVSDVHILQVIDAHRIIRIEPIV